MDVVVCLLVHLSLSVHESVTHVSPPICKAARGLDSCRAGHQARRQLYLLIGLSYASQASMTQRRFIRPHLEKWPEYESEVAAADGVDRCRRIARQINVLSIHMPIMCYAILNYLAGMMGSCCSEDRRTETTRLSHQLSFLPPSSPHSCLEPLD